jgi:hypothetical protein
MCEVLLLLSLSLVLLPAHRQLRYPASANLRQLVHHRLFYPLLLPLGWSIPTHSAAAAAHLPHPLLLALHCYASALPPAPLNPPALLAHAPYPALLSQAWRCALHYATPKLLLLQDWRCRQ